MSTHKRRINTIQALLAGCPAISGNLTFNDIINEYNDVYTAGRVKRINRRLLLQVLHSTRGLDSSLSIFTAYHNCRRGNSLGKYLSALEIHRSSTLSRQLSNAERTRYQNKIVDIRNKYMHEAGAFPVSDAELRALLSEMQDCIAVILSL